MKHRNIQISIFILLLLSPAIHLAAIKKTNSFDLPPPDSYRIFNLGPGCRFKIKMPTGMRSTARYEEKYPFGVAGLGIDGLRLPQGDWGMTMRCNKSDEEFVNAGWAINIDGNWQINRDEDNNKLMKLNALRFYELETMTWEGWAVAFDETYGEERFRQRTLAYCLVRSEKSICGTSRVGYLTSIARNRSADYTHYALALLKTVEFLNDVVPQGGNGTEWDSLKTDQTPP